MCKIPSKSGVLGAFLWALACLPQQTAAANSARHLNANQKRATLNADLGLSPKNLAKNGVALGFLPAWGEPMDANTCTEINAALPQPMSVVGLYAQITADDPTFSQIDTYMTDVYKQQGDLPVVNLALMPVEGFDSVTQEVANRIGAKMAELNANGVAVWLRYAHEMNGDWYPYGQQPEAFVASYTMVAEAVHAQAPQTYMLFAPNSMFAFDYNLSNFRGGYTPYWPGTEHVDLVGLSFYTYGGFDRLNVLPPANMALDTLQQFDQLYGSAMNKSLVLAETGASYTYAVDTWVPAPGNASESAIKFDWLWQLLGAPTVTVLPSIKAVTWFEVLKIESAGAPAPDKIEDFRLVLGNATVQEGAINFLRQASTVDRPTTGATAATEPSASPTASSALRNAATSLCMALALIVPTLLVL